jgi:hypothetical protein
MAVMASSDAVICTSGLNLCVLQLSILETLFLESGLKKSAASAATIIVGTIGMHLDEVFFTYHSLDYIA